MARLPGKWLETTVLVAGLLLLGVTLQKIGLAGLLRDLSVIGWGLAVILLVESGSVLLNTWGWSFGFPSGERPVAPWRLVAMRLSSDPVPPVGWGRVRTPAVTCAPHRRSPWVDRLCWPSFAR